MFSVPVFSYNPGEMLREEFLELRVPVTRITEILHERRAITADTALRLERYFGMSADFWLALQKDFELQAARQAAGKEIACNIKPHRKTAAEQS